MRSSGERMSAQIETTLPANDLPTAVPTASTTCYFDFPILYLIFRADDGAPTARASAQLKTMCDWYANNHDDLVAIKEVGAPTRPPRA